jgi:butyryl-CoA dehydrogenase
MPNPLFPDRDATFLLFEVLHAEALCALPRFADHSRQTFEPYVKAAARFAREQLLPSYRPMDEDSARYEGGRIVSHPAMAELYPQLVELGALTASRAYEVEGQQLPLTVSSMAAAYLMAGNASAFGYCMLTTGAAHLIEAFGSETLKATFMQPMYAGRFTGTMALTEPHAGSSLGDLRTRARPTQDGHHLIDGSKVFISGADQSFSENVVHLALARIEGAPSGSAGISLFAVPRARQQAAGWVDNDVSIAGTFHKLGWRGIASTALNFGERGDCHGYLVGEPNRGLPYMFQMMNEARINIGLHAVATAATAFQEALAYAKDRPQGRLPGSRPENPQVPIIQHADVRRMLLRQKAIVEGGLCLVLRTAHCQDLAEHATDAGEREHARLLLELLTPLAKSFPAEKGWESNTLAVQVHGGYGYTSEYLPEALLRDQKLNSIHEGTTGIQAADLLGRKVIKSGGRTLAALASAITTACNRAEHAGVEAELVSALRAALGRTAEVSGVLVARAATDAGAALRHAVDYLELLATVVVAWQWLDMASAAQRALANAGTSEAAFYRGKLQAARYYLRTELPRVAQLAALCESFEDSYDALAPEEL